MKDRQHGVLAEEGIQSQIERNRIPPIGWYIILVLGFFFVLSVSFMIYRGLARFDPWQDLFPVIAQFVAIVSIILYFNRRGNFEDEVASETRDKMNQKAIRASGKGVPWYVAPVLWIPVSMLATIWYFAI